MNTKNIAMIRQSIAIIAITAILYSCQQAPANKEPIIRNGVTIAYNSCGDADTTLLFVHGWVISKEYWDLQLSHFCPRYKVVSIDLPGFGESGTNRDDWSFDEYTDDVKAVIDQLKLKNVILIGHSMSGDIVLNADNKYPKSLIGIVGIDNLHEPMPQVDSVQSAENEFFFKTLLTKFDSTVRNGMMASLFQPSTDTSVINRVTRSLNSTDRIIAYKTLYANYKIGKRERELMKGLSHKLYLLNSDVQPVKKDSLAKYTGKGYHVETVHGTGHYPMLEKPAEFNSALEKILADIGKK